MGIACERTSCPNDCSDRGICYTQKQRARRHDVLDALGRHEARGLRLRLRLPWSGLLAPGVPVRHGHPLWHGQHEGPGLLGARIVRLRLGPLQMLLGLLRHEVPDADGTRVEYPVRASPLSLI